MAIADLFLRYPDLQGEDKEYSQKGVDLAWEWVEGKEVNPYQICDYIDGDINLPFRSVSYEVCSRENDIISAAFLAIGFAALYSCDEAGKMATESVENFGENEWNILFDGISKLDKEDVDKLSVIKARLTHINEIGGCISRRVLMDV